jgi:hypothetical protein
MFEFADEATSALTSKSNRPVAESDHPEWWTFLQLTVTRSAGVTHVHFKPTDRNAAETLAELRKDFTLLADSLVNDSRVLLDFAGRGEFCAASIEALAAFNRKLQAKGSRIALCNLDPVVQASFFPDRPLKRAAT